MMDRSRLTRRAVVAGAAASPLVPAFAAVRSARWTDGVQLWSVSADLEADFEGTLLSLARIGFRHLETAGLHGRSPDRFRRAADAAGLRVRAMHVPLPELAGDGAASFEAARILGASWVVCPAPLPASPPAAGLPWLRAMRSAMTLEGWRTTARTLNAVGSEAAGHGLRVAYHNHPFEFGLYDGQRGYDVLLRETDPRLVALELDVAWAAAAGGDPVALLRRGAGRFRLLHLKGLRARRSGDPPDAQPEAGVVGRDDLIPWPRVLAAAAAAGVEAAFIEQEPPHVEPALDALADCRAYLLGALGGRTIERT